eukprot:6718722-Alexandrium_andersonii.AAC.1
MPVRDGCAHALGGARVPRDRAECLTQDINAQRAALAMGRGAVPRGSAAAALAGQPVRPLARARSVSAAAGHSCDRADRGRPGAEAEPGAHAAPGEAWASSITSAE